MTWRGLTDPNSDLDALVDAYFRDQKILHIDTARLVRESKPVSTDALPGYDGRLFDWLTEMLNYGPSDGLEQAWPIVLELVVRAPDEEALMFIGSSALEDLVNHADGRMADRIQDHAKADPRLRRALRHVWCRSDALVSLKTLVAAARTNDG